MNDDDGITGRHDQSGKSGAPAGPAVRVNVEKYQSHLDGSGMTDKQKERYIEALWYILMSFVELGFGVHPLQDVCEQDLQNYCQRSTVVRNSVEPKVDEKIEDAKHLFPAKDPEDK